MMVQYPFIFSDRPRYRFSRHLAFWVFWWLFQSILYVFVPTDSQVPLAQRLPSTTVDSFLYMGSHVFLSYSLMYFVIPKYVVRSRYTGAAIWTLVLIGITAFIAAVTTLYLVVPVKELILPGELVVKPLSSKMDKNTVFHLAFIAGLRGGLTVGGMAAAIKLMKHWWMQGQRNLELQKEKVESQLQLLKAQVHPHFLFNTLNNIFSITQDTSVTASKMVMGLSDMLRYMLYECNQPLVPLSKELKMINEYIELEKIRYGNALELHVHFPRNARQFRIAPLLLLPFVENCFKHGISNMLEHPWLNIDISMEGSRMSAKIINSKPLDKDPVEKTGIGIENAKRRLELLYPGRYELTINDEEELFIVHLKLELERALVAVTEREPSLAESEQEK